MTTSAEEAQLRLQRHLGLSPHAAERAVREVMDCFALDVDGYIRARHQQLQAQGSQNVDIYQCIADELQRTLFRAPAFSARQIRRRIYG
jgi:hypothetical protein